MKRYIHASQALASLALVALISGFSAQAGDFPGGNGFAATQPMPTLTAGMYGTQTGDANSGNMGQYLCRSSSPIQFTINIANTNPAAASATLQMAVYDVDTDYTSSPEVDSVYVNNAKVGTLNGANGTWFYNVFNVPIGTLVQGSNTVKVTIDDNNGGWCVQVDWGVISLTGGSNTSLQIPRGWITPTQAAAGSYINIFAEVSGSNIVSVKTYYDLGVGGLYELANMTDPGKTNTYSGQFQLPAGLPPGYFKDFKIIATDANGNKAYWPGVVVQ